MESRLGEWVEPNKTWAFKTAPPTTGGLYVAITQCLHAVHIAASMHDHVCIPVFCLRINMYIYIYMYTGDQWNTLDALVEDYTTNLMKFFLWSPEDSIWLFTLI